MADDVEEIDQLPPEAVEEVDSLPSHAVPEDQFQISRVPGVAAAVGDTETADSVQPYHGMLDPIGTVGNMVAGPIVDAAAEPLEALIGNEIGSVGRDVVGLTGDETSEEALAKIGAAARQGKLTPQQEMQAKSPFISKEATAAGKAGGTVATKPPVYTPMADGGVVEQVDQLPPGAVPEDQGSAPEEVSELPEGAVPEDQTSESDAVRYAGAGNAIRAGLAGIPFVSSFYKGLRSGASALGVPDQDLDYVAPSEYDVAGRAAAHPTATEVGNVAGSLAELTGAPELGATGVLGRAAVGAAQLGVFQGAVGAADDWSQDKPFDAEKLAANVGLGAALGAAGPLLGGAVKVTGTGIGKTLDWVDRLAKDAQPGESFVGTIKRGYQAAGKAASDFVNDTTSNLKNLYDSASEATDSMYANAGQRALGDALEPNADPAQTPGLLEQAKTIASGTFNKIKDLTVPGEGVAPTLPLSPTSSSFITSNLQDAAEAIQNANTPLDVHNAMSKLATNIDRGIKFDKIPTAANQADQEIIRNIRSAIRGDLRDPELWGDAAKVYGDLSDHYSVYKVAQKNFQRDFMKSRTGPTGSTIKVVDPVKVNSFFADPEAPANLLKQNSLQDFVKTASANASYANNYDTYQQGVADLLKNSQVREALGSKIQDIKKLSGKPGLYSLTFLDALPLPPPVKATILPLLRYARGNGGYLLGGDLAKTVQIGQAAADIVGKVGDKISKGSRAIFRAGAADERE